MSLLSANGGGAPKLGKFYTLAMWVHFKKETAGLRCSSFAALSCRSRSHNTSTPPPRTLYMSSGGERWATVNAGSANLGSYSKRVNAAGLFTG